MMQILKNYSILYVEDEPEIRDNIAEYLSNYFGNVYTACDGQEALAQYDRYHPDALLMDINIPEINGLDVAKRIRDENDRIKIVMLTAYTDKEKLLKATELKLTKYLVKPVPPKEFKTTMEVLANELLVSENRFVHINHDYIWDKETEKLYMGSNEIILSMKERELLKLFILMKNSTITYEDIMVAVWEDSFDREISMGSVKNQVSLLRKKLPKDCLESIYAKGYRLKA